MLSLLLDENISPQVAVQIQLKRPDVQIVSVKTWHGGFFRSSSDELILSKAAEEGLVLVTYDQKTVMPILVQWGYAGIDHAGVVFIDDLSIATTNFGSIIRSLIVLWETSYQQNWRNKIVYLRPD